MLTYADDVGPVYQLWSGSNVTRTDRVTNSRRFLFVGKSHRWWERDGETKRDGETERDEEAERGRGAVVLAHLQHIKTHLTRTCELVIYAHTHPVTLAHTMIISAASIEP